jgi:bloom syndrome protein
LKDGGKNRDRHHPESTNVSSPIQQAAGRRRKAQIQDSEVDLHQVGYVRDHFVVSDAEVQHEDGSEGSSDGFEPVRQRGKLQRRKKPEIGPPIASDDRMATVTPLHRMCIEEFVHHGKSLGEEVSILQLYDDHTIY